MYALIVNIGDYDPLAYGPFNTLEEAEFFTDAYLKKQYASYDGDEWIIENGCIVHRNDDSECGVETNLVELRTPIVK